MHEDKKDPSVLQLMEMIHILADDWPKLKICFHFNWAHQSQPACHTGFTRHLNIFYMLNVCFVLEAAPN